MPVETAEDLAIFFDPRDFGVEALYTPRSGTVAPYRVDGIFDEPAKDFNPNSWPGGHLYQLQEGAHMIVTKPTFRCRAADLDKGGKSRDGLTIAGKAWTVSAVHPDGTGGVTLVLTDA